MTTPHPDLCRLISSYASPVPRYTSYPTAPHFHSGVGSEEFAGWIEALDPAAPLSLYLHVPYCDTLCWFCGCNTKITRRYDPVESYLRTLQQEIRRVFEHVPVGARVKTIHWGGGSPTILTPDDIRRLAFDIHDHFEVCESAEFAIEVDPRGFDLPRVEAMAEAGVTRASIGVQDFDPTVQAAINRVQSFDETRQAINWLRGAGIGGINVDMMYGLPHQTLGAISRTVEKVVALDPDRISLFGYAHVPWLKRHQSMIDESVLPDTVERYRQSQHAADLLCDAGYRRIGLDHFSKPQDSLSMAMDAGTLSRNFQGYTSDPAHALIGLGASAISNLPQGYCQNETSVPGYRSRLEAGELATVKGVRLGQEDIVRRWVIEQIMCDFSFSRRSLQDRYGAHVDGVLADAGDMQAFERDQLIEKTEDGFQVTHAGRPFVRTICAHFDTYLKRQAARHSSAV